MKLSPSQMKTVRHQFDSICRKVLRDESRNDKKQLARRAEKEINLSSKEFALLEFMIRNKNIVLSREKIENNLWNFDYLGGTNAVDVYIRYLRKKIDDDYDIKLIHTVRGSGYVLKDR